MSDRTEQLSQNLVTVTLAVDYSKKIHIITCCMVTVLHSGILGT